MYAKMNTQTGAASAAVDLANYAVAGNALDGLTVDTSKLAFPATADMPGRLYDWLTGLRLLRNVPLDYLVPDSALLPTESIRFFHVDETWIDRIIDGVFSAANTGTVDITYSVAMLEAVRATLDLSLESIAQASIAGSKWTPANGMTGMLIRSQLVRRWPDVVVRAYSGEDENTAEMPILRAEPISKDVYIAIFAGTPALVQLREPHVGVRFGVEVDETDKTLKTYYVEQRSDEGKVVTKANSPDAVLTKFPIQNGRVIPVATLGNVSRTVAIQLMRPPFVQQFGNTIIEQTSGKPVNSVQTEQSGYTPQPPPRFNFGPVRFVDTATLVARGALLEKLRKS
jgi:hypothetical protein